MISELYLASINYIVIFTVFIGIYYIFNKPRYALYIIIFSFPLKNFYIFIGTSFEIWKLLSLAFLLFKMPIWIGSFKYRFKPFMIWFGVFFGYVISITFVNYLMLLNININEMAGGWFKNEGRMIPQLVLFILTINLFFIPYYVLRNNNEIIKAIKVLLWSICLLSFFGVIQLFTVKLLGTNPFPIKGIGGVSHTAYIMNSVFRINSLAGEPKHMALAMVVGISILLLGRINKARIIKYDLIFLFLFMFNLFYTFSTTGYVLFLVSIFIIFLIKGLFNYRVIMIGIVLLISSVVLASYSSKLTTDTMHKQFSKADFEIQDRTIRDYFLDKPIHGLMGTGLGNIHHYAVKYFPVSFPLFRDTPYKANSGILFTIADYGLIGLIILCVMIMGIFKRSRNLLAVRVKNSVSKEINLIRHLSYILLAIFLFRYYELFFLIVGIVLSSNKFLEKELKIKSKT